MSDQLSLFAAPPATDRLFLAIFPDPPAATCMAEHAERLRVRHRLAGRPQAPERFHITLNHLGDHPGVRRDIVAMASEAAEAITASPFEVTFDRAVSFQGGGANPYVLLCGPGRESLDAFQRDLGAALARAGLGRWVDKSFLPHITLLRDRQIVPEEPVAPVTWTVNSFTLIHSLLGRTQHIPLARWPLIERTAFPANGPDQSS